ncbi:hypothetical protein BF49_5442 [Bradyrhizobium sp.]|nr:hypothetical protein [Bradyrhizobium sp.]CUT14362.1 hypothetical protein BF49_5442 [Bradyrhizobium sp.]
MAASFMLDGEAVIARHAGLPRCAELTPADEAVLFAFDLMMATTTFAVCR